MRRWLLSVCIGCALLVAGRATAADAARPEAIAIIVGDQHSAYDRTAQFVARVDRIKAENPGVPLAIFINGDSLEYGNAVARRSGAAVDFAMFRALAGRAPVVLNLGNHEGDFHAVPDVVTRLRDTGVTVISGNARDRSNGQPFAAAFTRLKLGAHELVIAGFLTDRLNTFRVALRPTLDLGNPVIWAREHLPPLLEGAALPVVLSHAGVRMDRDILPVVPDGTLFVGAHDHVRFVHRSGRTVYFHSGSWMGYVSVARLHRTATGPQWEIEQQPLADDDPAGPKLAALVRETFATHLTPEETRVIGRSARALGPDEAARFAVEAARAAAEADVAIVGGTTFGGGLPAGDVTRFAFDACVRFDGTLWVAEVDGAHLKRMLVRANQGPDTPFAERTGENLIAASRLESIVDERRYRLATTDWIAKNPRDYLGDDPPVLTEQKDLRLKAAVIAALQP